MSNTFQDVMQRSATERAAGPAPADHLERPQAATGRVAAAVAYRNEATLLGALRSALTAALLSGIWFMESRLDVDVPLLPLLGAATALGLSGLWLLSRARQDLAMTSREFTAQLLLDIALLSFALYWVGGSITNPFADLYVLFVCFAAITLPWPCVGLILAAVVASFSFLVWNHRPLPLHHSTFSPDNLESAAHWVHFVLTGSLVALFGNRLAAMHRDNRETLARAREEQARREAAMEFASLAAGTAHEMGTPLTTISMLVADMRDEPGISQDRQRELDVIWDALRACKRALREMIEAVGTDRAAQHAVCSVEALLESTLTRARTLRPGLPLTLALDGPCPAPHLRSGPTLRQALLNILNNAADASPDSVDIRVNWTGTDVYIDILDRGPGMPPDLRAKLGQAVLPGKEGGLHGNGLGAFLASTTVLLHGGRIEYLPRIGGGTCARVRLPTLSAPTTQ